MRNDLSHELLAGSRLCESSGRGPGELIDGDPHAIQLLSVASGNNATTAVEDMRVLLGDDVLPLPDEEGFGGVDINGDGTTDENIHEELNSYGGTDGRLVLQDYRCFVSLHGRGKQKTVNILFADSAVKSITDINGDGYINQGFCIDLHNDPAEIFEHEAAVGILNEAAVGILNNRCEVGPAELWSGPYIDDSVIKKSRFEQ